MRERVRARRTRSHAGFDIKHVSYNMDINTCMYIHYIHIPMLTYTYIYTHIPYPIRYTLCLVPYTIQ